MATSSGKRSCAGSPIRLLWHCYGRMDRLHDGLTRPPRCRCREWLRHRARDAWSLEALLGGRHLAEPVDSSASAQLNVERAEVSERVQRAVAQLPAGQRAAIGSFYLAGLNHAESAVALGIDI